MTKMASSTIVTRSGTSDSLFACIERMHIAHRSPAPDASWGRFLDAGTGAHSMTWVQELPLDAWVAVTADREMQKTVAQQEAKKRKEGGQAPGRIVLGNWDDDELLKGDKFDIVLADYLIGAMDGFSPFKQDLIFDRLKQHMAPNGVMYFICLEPIPYKASGAADIMVETTRLRDACILLAGHRCYREYPMEWVLRMLSANGFKVLDTNKFPILYSEATIRRQLDVASRKLKHFKSKPMAEAMRQHIAELDGRMVSAVGSSPRSRVELGFDYVIAAELDKGI